jgi:hypothetical protein
MQYEGGREGGRGGEKGGVMQYEGGREGGRGKGKGNGEQGSREREKQKGRREVTSSLDPQLTELIDANVSEEAEQSVDQVLGVRHAHPVAAQSSHARCPIWHHLA